VALLRKLPGATGADPAEEHLAWPEAA